MTFRDLGRRRSAGDPDGSKHQLGFIVFVVAMLLLITVLIAWRATEADAAPVCRGPVSGTSPATAGIGDHWAKLTASRWCGSTTPGVGWDGGPPSFSRARADGIAWKFERWFDTKTVEGVGTAPNGTNNIKYKAQWVAAEFEFCIGIGPAQVCNHRTNGVRIWAWANGNYTIQSSTGVPNLPMPRP